MGWRSTGAAFRAGNYNGPLTSDEGGFAQGFASTFVPGIQAAADVFVTGLQQEREQEDALERMELQETLRTNRAAASRSRSAESEDEEVITEAREWATSSLEAAGLPATEENIRAAMGIYTIEGTDVQRGNAFSDALGDGLFDTTGGSASTAAPEPASVPSVDSPDVNRGPDFPVGTPVDDLEATEGLPVTPSSMSLPDLPSAAPTEDSDDGIMSAASDGDMPVAEPAVYRPERDEAEIVEAQAEVANTETRLSFDTALPTGEVTSGERSTGVLELPEEEARSLTPAERAFMVSASSMSRDELASRLANEDDPNLRRILTNAYDARLEQEFMGLEQDELMVRARSNNPIIRDAAVRILDARQEVEDILAGDPARILEDLTTPQEVEAEIAIVRNNPNLREGTRNALIEILQGHQERLIELNSPAQQGVNLGDVRASNYQALAAQAEANGETALAGQIREIGQAMAASSPEAAAVLENVSSILARANAPVDEARGAVSGYLGAADAAHRMTQIVARNPGILTFFGGRVPATLSRFENELSSLSGLFASGVTEVSADQMGSYLDSLQAEAETLFTNGQIDAAARDYAMYRAQEARLAYMIVRSQQGQGGVISNQDYNSALDQVRSSSSAGTFEDSLRELIRADEVRVSSAIDAVRNNDQIRIASTLIERNGIEFPLVQDITRPLSDTAAVYGAGDAYDWLQGNVTLAEGVSLPSENSEAPTPANGSDTAAEAAPSPVETPSLSVDDLVERYRAGETITVTPELAEQYPSLRNRIGRTVRRQTAE